MLIAKKNEKQVSTSQNKNMVIIWFLGFQQLNFFSEVKRLHFCMEFFGFFFTKEIKSLFQTDSNSDDFNVIYW